MTTFNNLLTAYLIGGITFVPLLCIFILAYSYLTLPSVTTGRDITPNELFRKDEDNQDLKDKLEKRSTEHDVSAGYFAVCREYVAGGVNGKPPERTTPAGETIAAESPSVYQSMYRSIFERKTAAPSIEGGKPVKKARNVFYVVLRHGHLMLFDNAEQVEVRHVIALSLYDVDIHAGGKDIPEGELYIKRNCVRLRRRNVEAGSSTSTMPFYFFSENSSDKEDFYHALIHSLAAIAQTTEDYPSSENFDTEDMIKLIRSLHLSEENIQTRWLNALIGRLFLALYKTPETEHIIRSKITKKIDRAPKPNFITSLKLEDVDMGHCAPSIVNPRLKEMTVDGGLTLEADLKYNGDFRVVIAAVARLELGTHFKPRSVNLMLAGILRRFEGHLLIRIKPPPSNRLWISFETMPKMELTIEPIVSSKQITYGIVLRAIESRIREVMSETIVQPNWDDIPFTDTSSRLFRGGIWKHDRPEDTLPDLAGALAQRDSLDGSEETIDLNEVDLEPLSTKGKVQSMPTAGMAAPLFDESPGELKSASELDLPAAKSPRPSSRVMNVPAFDVGRNISPEQPDSSPIESEGDNTQSNVRMDGSSTTTQDSASYSSSPKAKTAVPSSSMQAATRAASIRSLDLDTSIPSFRTSIEQSLKNEDLDDRSTIYSTDSSKSEMLTASRLDTLKPSAEKRAIINQQLETAKKWGLNVLTRQTESWKGRQTSAAVSVSNGEPYGRGQPLPPLGEPLPGPKSETWSSATLGSLRKRPVPPPPPPRSSNERARDTSQPPPPLPPRAHDAASELAD